MLVAGFDEEFRKDYLLEDIKYWKTQIENGQFNIVEITGFVNKTEKIMTHSTILAFKRKNKNLAFEFILDVIKVLCNFNKNLNEQWTFLIYHGNNNKEFISNIIMNNKITEKRNVELVSLNIDNLTIDQYEPLVMSNALKW